MRALIAKLDKFSTNILLVFVGTSLVNLLNLLYQVLIAHRLSLADFAAFNCLLSIFVPLAAALSTLQITVAKYTAEFNAHDNTAKAYFFLSDFFKKTLFVSLPAAALLFIASPLILKPLGIVMDSAGLLLALLLFFSFLSPMVTGAVQGLELFGWLSAGGSWVRW